MKCEFCEHKIKNKPEYLLVNAMLDGKKFCCLGCLCGYVDELVIEEEENNENGLVN
ncbi:hypothetical protein JNUCC42_15350 [Brevibacterium sp. JNUCC-42]|nr:hypothetical protein JNUCC42_15350 [Brevibacterium sp. JNUCC-42]